MANPARIEELKKKFDENPRRYFAPLANEFRKAGDVDHAILICEEFLPQQPGHMSGHIVYGQALFEAGKLPESRAVFETALSLDPENLIALRHLGDIARSHGDHAAARNWYVRVLDADPRNEEIQELIATLDTEYAPVELPPQVIAAEAELIDARETPATPTPLSSQDLPPIDHDILPYAGEPAQADGETAPVELSAQVIAAEAELIDAGETPAPPAAPETEEEPEEVGARAPFVTETMAELYLAQGFREQARTVYVQLLAESPDDARLSGLVSSLAPASVVEDTGPNVRDFLARIAARQPGMRSAAAALPAEDDFASPGFGAAAETPPAERAAATINSGSIDALFVDRPPGALEDSAAAALAQAFRGEAIAPLEITGRPAHAATGELSLDSVFRDGPARPSRSTESFSFDQFFTGGGERGKGETPPLTSTEVAMPTEPPAEHSADDIEQFNAWLQGLKQR